MQISTSVGVVQYIPCLQFQMLTATKLSDAMRHNAVDRIEPDGSRSPARRSRFQVDSAGRHRVEAVPGVPAIAAEKASKAANSSPKAASAFRTQAERLSSSAA